MKKQRLTLFVSALLALGLASCGGESAPASTPAETPASTATKTNTKTTTSKSTTSKSSTSKSTTPAPVARPYIKLPFNSFEGSEYTEESVNKWTKNFTYKWTFWTSRAEEGITVAIGAQLTDNSHADRSLYTNHEGASSSDSFESNEANDGTPRIALANNGTASEVTHTTYGDAGLTASELNYFEIGNINVKKGKNVVTITTHAQTGYRLNLGGEIRLLYQVGEESLQGQEVIPTTTISSVEIAAEEEHAYLVYNVDYQNGEFDDVKAMDWQADFEGTTNGGGREWKYQAAADQVLSYADGGEGKLKVKVLLDNLPVNNYWSRFGLGLQASGNNQGKANETRFSGEAAAYQNSVTVGTRTYAFQADGGDDSYNLPFLKVSDSAEPSYEIAEVGMSQVNDRAIVTWSINYQNYTLDQIQAMDWQGAFWTNDIVANKGWKWIEYGEGKDHAIAVEDGGAEGKAKVKIDVTDYDLDCYMGLLGVGLRDKDGGQHAYECKPALGQNSSFQIGNKLYEFMPKGIDDTWGLPTLFINHAHVYEDSVVKTNVDNKNVTLRACASDEEKMIAINFADYAAISQTPDGTPSTGKVGWYLKKGSTVSWNVEVDKAIEGAVIEFGMIATSPDHLGRHLYNEAKEDALHAIPDTDPVQYEEGYVKQNTAGTPDKLTEDDWRVSVGVGDTNYPITNRKTMAENGAVQNQVCYVKLASINLAAGNNVIKLSQNTIGYRMQFNGEVRIYYSGDATITGNVPAHVHSYGEGVVSQNSDGKNITTYACTAEDDHYKVAMAFADVSSFENGENGWPADGKFSQGAVLNWKIVMPKAGTVKVFLGAKHGSNAGGQTFNPSTYALAIGETAGTIRESGTYSAIGLNQNSISEIEFGTIDVAAGEQTLTFTHNNSGYRLLFGGNLELVYVDTVA